MPCSRMASRFHLKRNPDIRNRKVCEVGECLLRAAGDGTNGTDGTNRTDGNPHSSSLSHPSHSSIPYPTRGSLMANTAPLSALVAVMVPP